MNTNGTVLIVDDESVGRKTLKALLFTEGYDLAFAANGPEALALAAELNPDVILLDVMMPGMDGFEVCRRLRANPQVAEVAVIMVTSLDDRDSRLKGIEAGADDFVSKPFDRTELRARVKTITSLSRYRRLHAERSRFEWVLEHTDDGYVVIDDRGRILYANPQARIQLNLSTEFAAAAELFLDLAQMHYQCQPQEVWQTWPAAADGATPRYLVQPASAISNALWLQVDVFENPADLAGTRLVRLRNVSASVEEQRLMWVFHGQLSHKLKTPLTLLNGFMGFLTEDLGNLPAEERDFCVERARSSASQLRKQIMSIFHYLDSHDVATLKPGLCQVGDIGPIVEKLAGSYGLLPVYHSSTVNGVLSIPLSAQVVELILQELLQNAQKFHPQQSPNLEIVLSNSAGKLRLQIIDDGQTLSAAQLARLWAPYYQAERGFSGQLPGMGLGLSTVASFVWNVGGTCRAYNRPVGPGLIVELQIPLINKDEYGLDGVVLAEPAMLTII